MVKDGSTYPLELLREYADGVEETGREAERQDPGVKLLWAFKEMFGDKSSFLYTGQVLPLLLKRTEEGWGEFNKGKPISDIGVAALLREYDIRPERCPKQKGRGYYQDHFKDAWERYFPEAARPYPENPSTPSSPSNPSGGPSR